MDRPTLAAIECAAIRAWPALETQSLGGWLWRYSAGGSQRANSAAVLDEPGLPLNVAIDTIEALYAERNAAPQFQITDVAVPAEIDARLADRGYRINDPCTTLAIDLDGTAPFPPEAVILPRASADWIATYSSVITPDRKAVAPQIIARVPSESAFVGINLEGTMAATALVVLDGPIAIVECVATHPNARRKGAARLAMIAAMHWAHANGARIMALGAVTANAPAQTLYRALGFRQVGRYHMRIRDGKE